MRDLHQNPLWTPEDLGQPIPGSIHSVSVCLPTWQDNIDYEERLPRVVRALRAGYPRFFYHPECRRLFEKHERSYAREGESCLAFPSAAPAERLVSFLRDNAGASARVTAANLHGVHTVFFPSQQDMLAKSFWQHTGEGISSRCAESCLADAAALEGTGAKQAVREQITRLVGVPAADVFLFPCGMNAIFSLHRVLQEMLRGRRFVQFGFPYVDTLKILQKFGPGVHFFPRGDDPDLDALEKLLAREPIAGLFTEFPSNPLLADFDLRRLADWSRKHGFPLVVDDTLSGYANVDLLPVADVICTSLTKLFSGIGDVAAGALVLNPRGPFHSELRALIRSQVEDLLWPADAIVLERNSRDYESRAAAVNSNAQELVEFLRHRPAVDAVYHPSTRPTGVYRSFMRPGGGMGGLLSILLHNPAVSAPRFFNALRVSKGPSLGTNYTLACPYTILGHYQELDFAESCGVSRYLVRVSVGLEAPSDLIARFRDALAAC